MIYASDGLVVVAVQSCNRPWALRLCLHYLWNQTARPRIEVWDDGVDLNRGTEMVNLLDALAKHQLVHRICGTVNRPPAETKIEADQRCGRQRKRIVDYFLAERDEPYLLLLDDDIILGPHTVSQLLNDFRALRSEGVAHPSYRVGALAVHGAHTVHREFILGRTVFAHLTLTGEGAVLLARDALEAVGNHFGPQPQGYADTQWRALYDGGWAYLTRINPPYEAQHLGLGDGSMIQQGFDAFWLRDAWRANTPGRPYLHVPGLDVQEFMQEVKAEGCRAACVRLHHRLQQTKERTMMPFGNVRQSIDEMPRPKGTLQLRVLRRGSKELVEEHTWDNVIVNNALFQFARLLAGEDQSERAITKMSFGAGSTAAAASDTALEVPLTAGTKVIASHEFPDARSVKFTAFLDETELNGFPITEAGLVFENGTLAARRTFPQQNKTEDFVFEWNWTVSWPAA